MGLLLSIKEMEEVNRSKGLSAIGCDPHYVLLGLSGGVMTSALATRVSDASRLGRASVSVVNHGCAGLASRPSYQLVRGGNEWAVYGALARARGDGVRAPWCGFGTRRAPCRSRGSPRGYASLRCSGRREHRPVLWGRGWSSASSWLYPFTLWNWRNDWRSQNTHTSSGCILPRSWMMPHCGQEARPRRG